MKIEALNDCGGRIVDDVVIGLNLGVELGQIIVHAERRHLGVELVVLAVFMRAVRIQIHHLDVFKIVEAHSQFKVVQITGQRTGPRRVAKTVAR